MLFAVLASADVHAMFSTSVLLSAASSVVVAALYVLASRLFFRRPAAQATALTPVIMPIAAYFIARYVFRPLDVELFSAVVKAALPTAQNDFLFASRHERGLTIARDVVLLSSIAAIPVLINAAALLT